MTGFSRLAKVAGRSSWEPFPALLAAFTAGMLVRSLLTHEQLNEFIALCRGANIFLPWHQRKHRDDIRTCNYPQRA
jgi:hypothetical protein